MVDVFEEREGAESSFTFILLFTLRVLRMINGVALIMVNNFNNTREELELSLRQEKEKSLIMIMLHTLEMPEDTKNRYGLKIHS